MLGRLVSDSALTQITGAIVWQAMSLANLKPDLVKAGALLEGTGARFCYFISPERQGRLEVRARMFFYGGEDPATGSAAGCAVSWMVQHGIANSDEQVLISQG